MLDPQGFWGAMQSQGAPNIQGDAYMTSYEDRTSRSNDEYNPQNYYQYAIEFPTASGGEVWLFDPGFCHVDSDKGTGENWNTGSTYGYSPHQPVSSFYDLYDSRNTLYHSADDLLVASSGSTFKRTYLRDHELDVSNPLTAPDCSSASWHNGWWKLADGLPGNKTYRLHTYSTDPSSPNDQRNTTALNSFAIYAKSSGGTPRVYGLGAMEAYVRLPGGRACEFYLAQIDAEHAGKTMVINLWDPGDTGNLAANLQILEPTATSATCPTNVQLLRAGRARTTATPRLRQPQRARNVDSVTTNTGGEQPLQRMLADPRDRPAQRLHCAASFVGHGHQRRWLVEDPLQHERQHYQYSTDLTTWEVELRGSPVHLVIP